MKSLMLLPGELELVHRATGSYLRWQRATFASLAPALQVLGLADSDFDLPQLQALMTRVEAMSAAGPGSSALLALMLPPHELTLLRDAVASYYMEQTALFASLKPAMTALGVGEDQFELPQLHAVLVRIEAMGGAVSGAAPRLAHRGPPEAG